MPFRDANIKQAGGNQCGIAVAVICAVWSLAMPCFAQEQRPRSAKQIVILYTHRTLTPINADWDRGIRSALTAGFDEPLDIEIEYLNLVRHKDPDYLRGWIELLKTKYAAKPPDLVLPVYVPALEFTLQHRETIFPNVPIVFCSAPPKVAERAHGQPKVTGVAFRLDIAGTVETAKRLHPGNKRLMVLSGSSELERGLKRATQDAILAMNTGVEIDFVEGLPRSQLLERVAAADRNTSILMLTYEEDSVGTNYSTLEIIEQMSSESSVPVYGLYDTLLGHGIVGGSLQSAESQGKLAGGLAVRVLKGERPEDMPIVGLDTVQMMFDARQLKRLNVSIDSLPPGSHILYREPTFWEQFGRYVLFGATAMLVQSLIIAALLVNRSRRVRAEREARDLSGKILTAQEDERRYLAREMHDNLSQHHPCEVHTTTQARQCGSRNDETERWSRTGSWQRRRKFTHHISMSLWTSQAFTIGNHPWISANVVRRSLSVRSGSSSGAVAASSWRRLFPMLASDCLACHSLSG